MVKKHKAFIGAAINAAMSIATSLINGNQQKKAKLRQAREENWNNAYTQANNLTEMMNENMSNLDRFDDQIQLRCGGRRKKKCGGKSKAFLGVDWNAEDQEALGAGIAGVGQLAGTYINRNQQLRCGGKKYMRGGGVASRHQGTATSFADSEIGQAINTGLDRIAEYLSPRRNNAGSFGGGHTGGGGAGAKGKDVTKVVTDTIPGDTIIVPVQQTFNDAFKNARERGDNTFEFNGKTYSTELGDNPDNYVAGQKRKRTRLLPIVTDTVYRNRYVTESWH